MNTEKITDDSFPKVHGWIGVDLDGTLAHYEGWPKDGSIGAPIPMAVNAVKNLLAHGVEVRIVTARACSLTGPGLVPELDPNVVAQVKSWCQEHIGAELPVIFWKDLKMAELWDDRAIQFLPNEGVPLAVIATRMTSIGTKMYQWASKHGGSVPPEGWEELRVVLNLPPPTVPEKKLIIPASALPKGLRGA